MLALTLYLLGVGWMLADCLEILRARPPSRFRHGRLAALALALGWPVAAAVRIAIDTAHAVRAASANGRRS